MPAYAVLTTVTNQPGILFGLTKVLADHDANISHVDIIPHVDRDAEIYIEFAIAGDVEPITDQLARVPGVSRLEVTPSFSNIYGTRILIMGGGAQVG
ncbi:MAG: ACT domain-containing protein, partial [Vicinamibacterales bacterium]